MDLGYANIRKFICLQDVVLGSKHRALGVHLLGAEALREVRWNA